MVFSLKPPPAVRWTVARRAEADSLAALDLHDAAVVDDDLHRSEAEAAQGPEHRRAQIGHIYKIDMVSRH
jgi:hypothetical protein